MVDALISENSPRYAASSGPRPVHVVKNSDLITIRLEGDYTLDVAIYVYEHIERAGNEFGYRLNLIDVRRAGTITPDARRYLLERRKGSTTPSVVAIVGASFAVRTVAHMVTRALGLLTKSYVAVEFFAEEIAAHAWIDAQRNRLRSDKGTK